MIKGSISGAIDHGEDPPAYLEAQKRRELLLKDDDAPEDEPEPEVVLEQDAPDEDETVRIPLAALSARTLEEPDQYTAAPEVSATTVGSLESRRKAVKPTRRMDSYLKSAVSDSVRIKMPQLSMTMGIMEFCVTDQALAFFVPIDTTFEPDLKTEIFITHNKIEYKVVYAGGFFTFHELGFSLVSFIRVDSA